MMVVGMMRIFDVGAQVSARAVGFAAELAEVVFLPSVSRHVIVVVARLMKAFAASRAAEGEGAGVRLQMTPESVAASK